MGKNKVQCNHCLWEGEERDLETDQETLDDLCPSCHQGDAIMDLTGEEEFTTEQFKVIDKMFERQQDDQEPYKEW